MATGHFMLFCVFLHCASVTNSEYVHITQYNNYNCEGWHTTTEYDRLCMTWPNFGYEISGIQIHRGSCVKLYKEQKCQGETLVIAYPNLRECDLPDWIEDHVLSVSDCRTRQVDIVCPQGSYVRHIKYRHAHEGITVYCYNTDGILIHSENTHPYSLGNPTISGCPIAAHGLSFRYDPNLELFHSPSMECKKVNRPTKQRNGTENQHSLIKPNRVVEDGNQHNNTLLKANAGNKNSNIYEFCDSGTAVVGVFATIDDGGGIKEAGFRCGKVTDPSSMCEPKESLGLVLHCDNSESSNEMQCRFAQTTGVGVSKTATTTELDQMSFYMDFGLSLQAGISGLSATMSASLGFSNLVGYEWSQSDSTTWSIEKQVEATMKISPHTISRIEQLIGKCSFYGISANFFKQTDVNVQTRAKTVKYFSI